jgi:hypothetical protein
MGSASLKTKSKHLPSLVFKNFRENFSWRIFFGKKSFSEKATAEKIGEN